MPYLRRASDNPFGLIPYGRVISIASYRKDASAGTIFRGDLVIMEADGNVAPLAAATDVQVVGVAAAHVASGSAGTVLVYDDAHQLYIAQDDGDTTPMTESSQGTTVSPIGFTGDSTTLQSITELDSSTAAVANLMFKVVQLSPIETGYASAAGAPRKWIVQINPARHFLATTTGI